jgi:hypothetical protein
MFRIGSVVEVFEIIIMCPDFAYKGNEFSDIGFLK